MADDDPAAAAATGLHIPEGSIRRVKLSVASNEEILKAQPGDALGKPFPITHCCQLQDNPSLGLPLQVGSCESCGATQINKCEGYLASSSYPHPSTTLATLPNWGRYSTSSASVASASRNPTKALGRKGNSLHVPIVRGYNLQDGFVMSYMCIPPNCLHISNLLDDNTAMCPPDTSKMLLRKVLRIIEQIKSSSISHPNFEACEVGEDDLQVAVANYINMGGPEKGTQSVAFTRQPAPKQWQQRMKTLFISKSSSFTCRAVITGDPYIGLDVVGVPDEIAGRMSVEEHVTDYNIARLQAMMDKGLCLTYTDVNSNTYDLIGGKGSKKRTTLRVGETVDRRVLDGDLVFLNRSPSTDKHSIQALYVHVHDDHTIKINPLICVPLEADFDGDCVHIFFPRSVSARVEATELFTVENQLMNSHSAKLNFQIKNDYLLALKIMCDRRYSRQEANQIAMFSPGMIPEGDHYWTIPQILQTTGALTTLLASHTKKESVGSLVTAIISSTHSEKGPREAMKLLNLLQPLLMESLLMDGFSMSLRDFDGPSAMQKVTEGTSLELDEYRESIVDFIAHASALGLLIDPKSDSALRKLVEQLGFLGRQLQNNGTLYSCNLVEDCYKFLNKCSGSTKCYDPLKAHDVVMSSFYNGLNPHEELLHSISVREKIERSSSKGLAEPSNLFKNMMAILRDVIVCYDGTIRTSCSNLIVQFGSTNASRPVTPSDPVGILAATAVANAAYKAVLDPNQNNISSWDSMKEVPLTRATSITDTTDQKAILYLDKCFCGLEFCMEEQHSGYQLEATQAAHCLVGHIHLEKENLNRMEITMGNILQTCQEVISKHEICDEKALQVSCLQFFLDASTTTGLSETNIVQLMTNAIFPILLDTIIKGDPRVKEAKVIWVQTELTCWVQNSSAEQNGELALEITVEKAAAAECGGTWGVAMDACVPVMDLIDTTRSMPYNIQEVHEVFGISCAFDRVRQHLSKAVGMVIKAVLTEHLTTVASSMTCTGSLHGFSRSGCKATLQSLKIQAPFTEATLSRPMQCFRKSAEKVDSDQLANIVSACFWGCQAAIGTGSTFEIHWKDENQSASNEILGGYGLYDFLATVGTIGAAEQNTVTPHSSCLYDVDKIPEDQVQEDEVICLGGNLPISWTDKPKADSLLLDFKRRTGIHSTRQERQGMQNKSNSNSVENWKNDRPSGPLHSAFAGSTSSGGWNKKRFSGQVFERKQPKHSWSSAVTHQGDKPSWYSKNAAGVQKYGIAESSSSGGFNRKNSGVGRGGGRGMRKSGAHHGGGNSRNSRAQNNCIARQGGISYNFTPVEQQIYAQVEPIMKNVKRIIRDSRDGMKLSQDDEMFIVNNVLLYHPEKEKKMAGQGNYIMVAKHQTFHSSRCLYVATSDGSSQDFSYKKCLENFIRIRYPDAADSFCRKYFK
ncbi:DNA-directed RNA polymerase V subunit 1-like [Panicum miliaceum]|uniref:DNA-directed RNA polymerase n=1 Tax=Panicum miliaceum TaxID=4540 RepID=A0A3L6QCV6_PANMI|nr:DNA-directed RNA polymerase V subunit 1-like [Panicum miliaceum]